MLSLKIDFDLRGSLSSVTPFSFDNAKLYNFKFEIILIKFFSESYLLKKRLKRAINKGYEKELLIINKFADKSKDALDVGVYRGVYSYKLSKFFKHVHSFEPNPLLSIFR